MKSIRIHAVVALLLGGVLAQAQDKGMPSKSVQMLNRAPVNKEVLVAKIPQPTEIKLSNGLTVLLLERHKLPTIRYSLWVDASSLYDPKAEPGMAKFTAEMLREGTTHRSSVQLAREIDGLGATLAADTDFGSTYTDVHASGLAQNAEKLLDLLSDLILNPAFANDELDKYKKRQTAQLEEQRSDPDFLAQERMFRALYHDYPAAVTSPTNASIDALSADKLKQFHARYYVPGNSLLGVVGDFDSKRMTALLEKYLGGWKGAGTNDPRLGAIPEAAPATVYLVDRPDSVQSDILAGQLTVANDSPDYIPLRVANRVFGEGASSRLFLNLREEKGYTYGAYSYIPVDNYPRPLLAGTQVRNAVTDGSMHELMGEFKRLRDEPVPDAELDAARRAIIASFALSLENNGQLLELAMRAKHNRLPADYWNQYPARIGKVTPAAIQQVAKKYLNADHLQVVCVGSGKEIRESLRKYGTVEVYSVDGKKVAE